MPFEIAGANRGKYYVKLRNVVTNEAIYKSILKFEKGMMKISKKDFGTARKASDYHYRFIKRYNRLKDAEENDDN